MATLFGSASLTPGGASPKITPFASKKAPSPLQTTGLPKSGIFGGPPATPKGANQSFSFGSGAAASGAPAFGASPAKAPAFGAPAAGAAPAFGFPAAGAAPAFGAPPPGNPAFGAGGVSNGSALVNEPKATPAQIQQRRTVSTRRSRRK